MDFCVQFFQLGAKSWVRVHTLSFTLDKSESRVVSHPPFEHKESNHNRTRPRDSCGAVNEDVQSGRKRFLDKIRGCAENRFDVRPTRVQSFDDETPGRDLPIIFGKFWLAENSNDCPFFLFFDRRRCEKEKRGKISKVEILCDFIVCGCVWMVHYKVLQINFIQAAFTNAEYTTLSFSDKEYMLYFSVFPSSE